MAYKNNQTGQIGNLKQLLPRVSNPQFLTEAELTTLNIVKYVKPALPGLSLEELKQQKLKGIKSTLSEIRSEGFMCSLGFVVDCEQQNVSDFAQGKQLLDVAGLTGMKVRDYNNINQDLNSEQYTNMVLELAGYVQQLLKEKWDLSDLVNTATTKEEVEAIYWRTPILDAQENVTGYNYNPILGR